MIVTDGRVAAFVAGKCGISAFYTPFTCLGVERNGQIVAGVVFNCFQFGRDISATVAGEPGAFGLMFAREVGRYVFERLGCARISITTEQPAVIALAGRLGAKIEGAKRDLFGDGRDGVLLGICKQDWKFR